MNATLESLKATLSDLPVTERAQLAEYLLRSLETQDEDVKAEWLALAKSRMEEVQAGRVIGIPAEEVLKNLLEPKL